MMVPRTFLFTSPLPQLQPITKDERESVTQLPPQSIPRRNKMALTTSSETLRVPVSPSELSVIAQTSPVIIPPKRHLRSMHIINDARYANARFSKSTSGSLSRSSSTTTLDRSVPNSVAFVLESTAIPVPRRSWNVRGSRKLPPGNHVEHFSRLLFEGVPSRSDNSGLFDGSTSSTLDSLLSPPDETGEKSMLSTESESPTPLSVRSTSTDSIPSLDHDWDSFSVSSPSTPVSANHRKLPPRRKQFSPPQDCVADHPLLEPEIVDSFESIFLSPPSIPSKKATTSRTFPRLGSSFKSNLTASLRAIKSAAQSVSNFATPSVQPDDFLTRSLFTITPELTDDRRPRPLSGPPSPALRRYLNPITLSPSEMHIYHESPRDPTNSASNSPVSIQMQTYNRTGSRQTRFYPDRPGSDDLHIYSYDPEITPSRQREPRENSDFLRMVVLEMNMRRSGKLRDDIPTRAKVWLPPRKINQVRILSADENGEDVEGAVPQRWVGVTIECT